MMKSAFLIAALTTLLPVHDVFQGEMSRSKNSDDMLKADCSRKTAEGVVMEAQQMPVVERWTEKEKSFVPFLSMESGDDSTNRMAAKATKRVTRKLAIHLHHAKNEEYEWKNVPIGGGGFVTGIVIHPHQEGVVYIRTDIGGAYRLDATQHSWIPLTDWIGTADNNLYGIDGFALDPTDADVIYLAAGKYPEETPHDVLKSTDGGATWQSTNFYVNDDAVKSRNRFGGNRADRWIGECLAVSPDDGRTVLAATRTNGLWISYDAASLWEMVTDIPSDRELRTVCFSTAGTAYVAVPDSGLFISQAPYRAWHLLDGAPRNIQRLVVVDDSLIWATDLHGVYMFDGRQWHDVSPIPGIRYGAIDVDPFDRDHVIVSSYAGTLHIPFWRSTDGGTEWTELQAISQPMSDVPWAPVTHFASATSAIVFDPHCRHRVWLTDWYATWHTDDIAADSILWTTHEMGHEEIVPFLLITPPIGTPLISCVADVRGFIHDDLTKFPLASIDKNDTHKDITGMDFCESDPRQMVRTCTHGTINEGTGALSADGGITWSNFPSWEYDAVSRVAMSATDHNNIVAIPWKGPARITNDGAVTWHSVEGLPEAMVDGVWKWHQPLASDRVLGNVFYAMYRGQFYRSDDSGHHFHPTTTLPSSGLYMVVPVPGIAAGVWVSIDGVGLFRSDDGGETFTKVDAIASARLLAFGKHAPRSRRPTVFIYGVVNGIEGIFRSDDFGDTWVRINDDAHRLGDNPNSLAGDRQVYGRVYIGTNGRGIFYGQKK